MINLMVWPKFWVLHVPVALLNGPRWWMCTLAACTVSKIARDMVNCSELYKTLLQCAEGFLIWELLNVDFTVFSRRWCCSSVVIQCRWSWLHQVWAVTNRGYWFCSSEVISLHLFYCCLCNCPHYPPQPQLVCLMPRRRREHMHQRAGARISVESKSAEIWNASLCQPVYFARCLCRCIIIYLLQQNCDGTFLFEPFLLVRSLPTCNLLWIL